MIFPTIMFWVWMAAQCPSSSGYWWIHGDPHTYKCPVAPIEFKSTAHGLVRRVEENTLAEHVIEIRTKQECHTISQTERSIHSGCGPIREIWIDGVKFGVLRESSR